MSNKTATSDSYKYRLSLTARQIQLIMERMITPETITSPEILDLMSAFAGVNKKIAGGEAPDYIPTPRETIADKLGMHTSNNVAADMSFGMAGKTFQSKEVYWEYCYMQHMQGKECTPAMLEAANEHRYLNDLMSKEEEAEFEEAMFTDNTL